MGEVFKPRIRDAYVTQVKNILTQQRLLPSDKRGFHIEGTVRVSGVEYEDVYVCRESLRVKLVNKDRIWLRSGEEELLTIYSYSSPMVSDDAIEVSEVPITITHKGVTFEIPAYIEGSI